MKDLINKFVNIERKLSADKGSFSLFALFLREDAPGVGVGSRLTKGHVIEHIGGTKDTQYQADGGHDCQLAALRYVILFVLCRSFSTHVVSPCICRRVPDLRISGQLLRRPPSRLHQKLYRTGLSF